MTVSKYKDRSIYFKFSEAKGLKRVLPVFQPLRKHAYSNILTILQPKTENFQIKNCDIFHISTQTIYCGYSLEPPRRGGSNGYHNLCFFAK